MDEHSDRNQNGVSSGDGGSSLGGRTPPHNREAERAVLGALLIDPERVTDVSELLHPDSFYDRRHQLVYRALLALVERNAPVDLVSLCESLRAQGAFQQVGGLDFLIELEQSVTSSALLTYHSRIVSETAQQRALIRVATDLIQKAYETRPDGEAVQQLMAESEQRIFELSSKGDTQFAEPIGSAIEEAFKRLDARSDKEGITGLTTGYYELDDMLCGLNGGELLILAARPSMGKTAFALNVIENAALSRPAWLNDPPTILLFSLEMGRQSLVSRMLCSRARVPAHLLRSGRLSGDRRAELAQAADELRRTRIHIDDSPGLTMMALRSRARRLKAQMGLHLVVVDYLQLISFPRSESRQQEISSISRSLKELARELDVPVIALAQLSRAVEARDPPRPQLADLRESGSIEQDADVVMMLYRAEYYSKYRTDENLGMAEVIVAKQRNGPTGEVKLQFFQPLMRFDNPAPTNIEAVSL